MKVYSYAKIFDLLELLKENPLKFLSEASVVALQDFLNGYLKGNPHPKDDPPFWNFEGYMIEKTGFKPTEGNTHLISRILLKECCGDQHAAFIKFFIYLEEFKATKNVT